MNIVIPIADSGKLFESQGYPFAKPVTEIDGKPLVEHAFDCLKDISDARFIFVIRKEDDLRFHLKEMLHLLDPNAVVIQATGATAGAACTVLLAVEYIANEEELIIANGDQVLEFDVYNEIQSFRDRNLDGATIVFDSVHPRWSFVKTDADGIVVEAAEKRPVSRNATAGFYYYSKGRYFVEAAQNMIRKNAGVNGAFFVCPAFNEMILDQKTVGISRIDRSQYVSLATPQAIEEYEQALATRRLKAEYVQNPAITEEHAI